MRNAPARFLNALLWPVTIWESLTHLREHPADDYIERTSPIVGSAVGFWICLAGIVALWLPIYRGRLVSVEAADVEQTLRIFNLGMLPVLNVLVFFLPIIYAIGFWLFTARDERYPR